MTTAQDLYPSRVGQHEQIIERMDPVVYGAPDPDLPHALDQEQLDSLEQNGFLVLPELMPEMVEPLLAEAQELKTQLAGRDELIKEPDSDELRSIFAIHQFGDLAGKLARDPRILNPIRQIMGSDAYLMQSRLNIKPAYKGRSFSWHSDFETWHVEDGMPRMRALTAWVMLTENNEFNGPLYVIPGSHKKFVSCEGITEEDNHKQSLRRQIAGVPRPETIDSLLQEQGIQGLYGKPGTVVIHECNLLHGSPDNISPWPRSLLMYVYNSVHNQVVAPFSGMKPRPDYLSSPDPEPLTPLAN